jgi:hypothetical protein
LTSSVANPFNRGVTVIGKTAPVSLTTTFAVGLSLPCAQPLVVLGVAVDAHSQRANQDHNQSTNNQFLSHFCYLQLYNCFVFSPFRITSKVEEIVKKIRGYFESEFAAVVFGRAIAY